MFQLLFDFLTPKHHEIAKKDEDKFIFVAESPVGESVILSKEFGAKIKYKILLSLNLTKNDLRIKTVCFFCKFGSPQVVDVDPSQELLPIWRSTISQNPVDHVLSREFENNGEKLMNLIFPDFVKQFNGFKLVAANSVKTFQRTEMFLDKDGEYKPIRGLYFTILDVMRQHFNFTVKIIPSFGDGGTGLLLKNGTWLGSVADILHGRAHIGMVSAQTFQRNDAVGFAFSLNYEWITFTTGKPKTLFSWKSIFKPFDVVMWSLVVSSVFGVTFTFVVIDKYISNHWGLRGIISYIVGSIFEQYYEGPSLNPIRILCACWLLFSLVISCAYRSKIFVFLMFPELTKIPQNFEELSKSTDFTWGLNYVAGAAYAVFATSTEQTYVKIFKGMELIRDPYECFHKAATTNFACISWQSFSEYNSHRNFTDRSGRSKVMGAPSFTFFIPCGWVLEKRAIFRTNFDRVLHMGHDTGLVKKWEAIDWEFLRARRYAWEKQSNYTEEAEETGSKPLTLRNLTGGFWLLIIGILVSVLLYLTEIIKGRKLKLYFIQIWKKNQQHQKSPRDNIEENIETNFSQD
ncbi:unnamed protein product [Allacma fusca]|uniref:Ionotropic glutamate receptor C-terminal domain-containing protein n=1 Tax=Allacma fusca TaxID=39272 RepID=A0A8J2Q3X8_9HEXA|nr:unnamed protein product [Allacma fusca]